MKSKGLKADASVNVGMQGTRYSCKKTCQSKGVHLCQARIHSHGICCTVIVSDSNEGPAISGFQQVSDTESQENDYCQDYKIPEHIMIFSANFSSEPENATDKNSLPLVKKRHEINDPLENHLK